MAGNKPPAKSFNWPDMLQTLTNPLSRWFLACAVLAAPLAFSSDGLAQVNDRVTTALPRCPKARTAAPAPQAGQPPGATGNPICQRLEVPASPPSTAAPARAIRPRTSRSAVIRKRRRASRANSTASPQQAKRMGCEFLGLLLAVQPELGAMRSGQQPDPADARQSRPDHHEPRTPAKRRARRRRPREPAPLRA